MAVRQYVGARYVPKFADPLQWQSGTSYEALTIVTYNNSSYTSKIPVPATVGNPADNPTYWVLTGNYNAQIETYRTEIATLNESFNREKYTYNVADYGAKGDGSTDDTEAINSCVAAATNDYTNDRINRTIFFPGGTYIISNTISIPYTIHLYSKDEVVLKTIFNGTAIWYNSGNIPNTGTRGLHEYNYGHAISSLGGFIITSSLPPSTSNTIGIEIGDRTDVSNVIDGGSFSLNNVLIYGQNIGIAYNMYHVYITKITNCGIEGCLTSIDIGYRKEKDAGENLSFINCIIGQTGLCVKVQAGTEGITFTNCSFDFFGTLIYSTRTSNIKLIGCHIEGISLTDKYQDMQDSNLWDGAIIYDTTGSTVNFIGTNFYLSTAPSHVLFTSPVNSNYILKVGFIGCRCNSIINNSLLIGNVIYTSLDFTTLGRQVGTFPLMFYDNPYFKNYNGNLSELDNVTVDQTTATCEDGVITLTNTQPFPSFSITIPNPKKQLYLYYKSDYPITSTLFFKRNNITIGSVSNTVTSNLVFYFNNCDTATLRLFHVKSSGDPDTITITPYILNA